MIIYITITLTKLVYQFTANPGLSTEAENCETALDFFNLFFSTEVKEMIHTETTRYAKQNMPTEEYLRDHPNARGNEWQRKPMMLEEVDTFLATAIIIGIMGFPKLR